VRRAAVYLVAIVAMSGQTTAGPQIYRNPEFGIRLRVPDEGTLCAPPKDEHDHGFGVLLGGGSTKDCGADAHHRSVWLFAFFNALDDTKHLPGLLRMGCNARGGRCQPGPPDLQTSGLQTATGRVNLPDGWIEIVVVTQAGTPTPIDPNEPSVNYIFSLYTRPEHLDHDLRVFRTILQTVEFKSGVAADRPCVGPVRRSSASETQR
jgi:hypothetical protein